TFPVYGILWYIGTPTFSKSPFILPTHSPHQSSRIYQGGGGGVRMRRGAFGRPPSHKIKRSGVLLAALRAARSTPDQNIPPMRGGLHHIAQAARLVIRILMPFSRMLVGMFLCTIC